MNDRRKLPQDHVRVKLTAEQIRILNDFYSRTSRPGNKERVFLSQQLGIGLDKVKNWFQNRRAKEKKDFIENSSPSQYSEYVTVRKPLPTLFPSCNDLFRRRNV